MLSNEYRNSHCADKTVVKPSYLHKGIPYTSRITSLHWIRAQVICGSIHSGTVTLEDQFSDVRLQLPGAHLFMACQRKRPLGTWGVIYGMVPIKQWRYWAEIVEPVTTDPECFVNLCAFLVEGLCEILSSEVQLDKLRTWELSWDGWVA